MMLAWFDAAGSIVWLTPFVIGLEREAIAARLTDTSTVLILAIIIGSAMAAIYNVVVFYVIKATSSVTYIILGNFKQVVLLGGAALFLDHVSAPLSWVGIALFLMASSLYTYVKYTEGTNAAAASPSAPTEASPFFANTRKGEKR